MKLIEDTATIAQGWAKGMPITQKNICQGLGVDGWVTENPPDRPPRGQQIQKMLLSFELSSLPSFQVTSIM